MTQKTSFGIRIKDDLVEKLNEIVEGCIYLNTSRSEVVETILWDYFNSDDEYIQKVPRLIVQKRERKL